MKKSKKTEKQGFHKFVRLFWIIFLTGITIIALIFFLASVGVFGELPDHTQLENPKTNLASEVISSDGKTLAKFSTVAYMILRSYNNGKSQYY